MDAWLIREIHGPEVRPDDIVAAYPSHLHIDLLERARRQGTGRALIEGQLSAMRALGSEGVHVDVALDNRNAIEFYRHLGFAELRATSGALIMGLRLR